MTVTVTDVNVTARTGFVGMVSCGNQAKTLKLKALTVSAPQLINPLLRACSSSAALTAAGLHTHVRTYRTSSDPAYLHTYVYLYMRGKEGHRRMLLFPESGSKKISRVNGFTKSVILHLRSIGPNVQRTLGLSPTDVRPTHGLLR